MKEKQRNIYRLMGAFLIMLTSSIMSLAENTYVFHHLNIEDGLSNNKVKTFLKDNQGYLWIGTENGLNRYDGYGFKIYQPQKSITHTLPSCDIWTLQEDGEGNLWVYDGSMYAVYNRRKDNFDTDIKELLQQKGINITQNYRIHIDKKQNLWVFQDHQVDYYQFKSQKLFTQSVDLPTDYLLTADFNDDGKDLYLLYQHNMLVKLTNQNNDLQSVDIPSNLLNEHHDLGLYLDLHGGKWIFSYYNEDIYYQKNNISDWKKLELHSPITTKSNAIRSIIDDANDQVWIATDHKGIFIYNYVNDTWITLHNDPLSNTSLASNRINTIYRDDSGVIWVGNNKSGISFYHDSFLEFIDTKHQECGDIATMLEDKDGNIWIGTDGNGLYIKEKNKGGIIRKIDIPNITIMDLLEDKKGRIWAGTYQDGLFCFDHQHITHYTSQNSHLPYNGIWSLIEDKNGNLWIGNVKETLTCFHPDNNTATCYLRSEGYDINVTDLFYDGADKLYVGTYYGLGIMDIVTRKIEFILSNRSNTKPFKQFTISNIFKDKQDILWLGHKEGLTGWDLKTDSIYQFDANNGLCDNIIKSITQDLHGNIWFATSNGISILSKDTASTKNAPFSFRNLSTKDGLQNNYFNTHSNNILSNGDLLFGSTNGYALVNPNKLHEKNNPLTKVTFTDLKIGNQVIEIDSLCHGRKILSCTLDKTPLLKIAYNDNLISIGYMAGDLLNAEKIKYAYKLEGLNHQWFYTNDNKIVFTTLPAGTYTLAVKSCNSDGVWNHEPSKLEIIVTPPIYLNHFAIISYVLITLLIIGYTIYYIRKRQLIKLTQQQMKVQQEQNLQLNEMKLKFFTNISHDLRTPLTLIISPLQMLLSEPLEPTVIKKLEVMNKNAQQLLGLINSLLDFRKLDVGAETLHCTIGDIVSFVQEVCNTFQEYASEHSYHLSFMSEMNTLSMSFDPVKIKKVMNNLLSNAFKYTPEGGEINIHLYQENDQACICVADNGQGISDKDKKKIFARFYQVSQTSEKTGSGIGLHIAYEYIQLHHGNIILTDNLPQGSIFTVKLPIASGFSSEENAEATSVAPTQPMTQSKYSILVVDDNKDFCHFMSEFLSDEYQVYTAYNGSEALDFLQNQDVNIVVSDIMMPVMSGTELCYNIKHNMKWSHIPVILLTARMADEYKTEGYKQGADDYIVKPFDFKLLKMRIKKFIEWTKKSHRKFSQTVEVAPDEITITPLDEQFISKAIKIVEDHMSDTQFTVEVLGAELGLSRSHLYKKLMCITGKGPADFIRILRLKRSKQLLKESQKQIAEIAYEVGFNSPKRFAINFKNEFGLSPSEYVRSLK